MGDDTKTILEATRRITRHDEMSFRISPDCSVQIKFNGPVTQNSWKFFMQMVAALEVAYVETEIK